jgi:beta-glucosidase
MAFWSPMRWKTRATFSNGARRSSIRPARPLGVSSDTEPGPDDAPEAKRLITGVTLAARQVLGSAEASDWRLWEGKGKAPRSDGGNGFAASFADDFGILAEHGITNVRLGFDWSRLEPRAGHPDDNAMEEQERWLSAARSAGVAVWAELVRDSVPGWFLDEGGFLDDKSRGLRWPRYVDMVAERFGDQLAGWFPLHDPVGYAGGGYRRGTRPPGLTGGEMGARALRGQWWAWRDAWRILRGGGAPVVTSLWIPISATDGTLRAGKAERRLSERTWELPIRALRDGELAVPGMSVEQVPDLQDSCDIVGIVWRGGTHIDEAGDRQPYPIGRRADDRGRAPWAEGLNDLLHRLHDELPNRAFAISEMGVASTDDGWVADEVGQALEAIADARGDRIDVRALFFSDALDGYDSRGGFDLATGAFDRDRNARAVVDVLGRR